MEFSVRSAMADRPDRWSRWSPATARGSIHYNHAMLPYSEPSLSTEPTLLSVLDELKSREPIFHHPELGTTRADFDKMMAPDFWEVGASGRRYSRGYVLEVLVRRASEGHVDDQL